MVSDQQYLKKNTLFFRAVSGLQQNKEKSTEISGISRVLPLQQEYFSCKYFLTYMSMSGSLRRKHRNLENFCFKT